MLLMILSYLILAGVALYNFALKEVPLRKMFLYTSLLGAGLGMTQILLITGKPHMCTVLYLIKYF